jgi:GNAT superfamily N-acetyltransferase
MGLQDRGDVALIRHAYTRTAAQGSGAGSALMAHLKTLTHKPMLVGTWKAATWAIRFYEKRGFRLTGHQEKERLLRRYWSIPERQIEESVVLSDQPAGTPSRASGP